MLTEVMACGGYLEEQWARGAGLQGRRPNKAQGEHIQLKEHTLEEKSNSKIYQVSVSFFFLFLLYCTKSSPLPIIFLLT